MGAYAKDGTSWDLPDPDFLPLQRQKLEALSTNSNVLAAMEWRLRGRCVEDMATIMLRASPVPSTCRPSLNEVNILPAKPLDVLPL